MFMTIFGNVCFFFLILFFVIGVILTFTNDEFAVGLGLILAAICITPFLITTVYHYLCLIGLQ